MPWLLAEQLIQGAYDVSLNWHEAFGIAELGMRLLGVVFKET